MIKINLILVQSTPWNSFINQHNMQQQSLLLLLFLGVQQTFVHRKPREKLRRVSLVNPISWVFVDCDAFAKGGTSLKQQNQQLAAYNRPVRAII
mgnify:CR=1 FL=1